MKMAWLFFVAVDEPQYDKALRQLAVTEQDES